MFKIFKNNYTGAEGEGDGLLPEGFELVDPDALSSSEGSMNGRRSDEEEGVQHEEYEDGCFYDHPLWYGKTKEQIRYATDLEKSNGNAASRDGDWKRATRYWKNALRGAQKLQDLDLELRLRLNLALGFTRQHKTAKALAQCDKALQERLKATAPVDLRSKAHYRKAEAHEASGEVSKAIASLKIAVQVDPSNLDARKKWAELKRTETERHEREKMLFRGFIQAKSSAECPSSAPAVQVDSEELRAAFAESQRLTDRAAASRLASRLTCTDEHCSSLNVDVGAKVRLFGPLNDDSDTEEAPKHHGDS